MSARKTFSKLGFAMLIFLAAANASSFLLALTFEMLSPGALKNTEIQTLISFISIEIIGFLLFFVFIKNMPKFKPKPQKVSIGMLFVYFVMCFSVSVFGSLLGTILSELISGGTAENYVDTLMQSPGVFTVLEVTLFAPIAEELICRKFIIDRTVRFGEKTSVIFSAVIFGLMHGNFYQFFYAFAIGIIFGYIYVRSGKVRYTVIIHTLFNFICGVLPGFIGDSCIVFPLLQYVFIIAGIVFLAVFSKKAVFEKSIFELNRSNAFKAAYLNCGMLLFFVASVFEFILSLL